MVSTFGAFGVRCFNFFQLGWNKASPTVDEDLGILRIKFFIKQVDWAVHGREVNARHGEIRSTYRCMFGTFLWWMVASARNLHPELQAYWEEDTLEFGNLDNKRSACQQEKIQINERCQDAYSFFGRRYYPAVAVRPDPRHFFGEGTSLQVILRREIHKFPQLGFGFGYFMLEFWLLSGSFSMIFLRSNALVVQPW